MKRLRPLVAVCLSLTVIPRIGAQDHGHLNVGSSARTQGAQLTFDNGLDFVTTSGYVKTLTYTNAGKYAGLYQGNITLTALHANNALGEPIPTAPLPGAFIVAEIVSVSAPAGGQFQFWETNSSTVPTFSSATSTADIGFRLELSESALGAGEPGGDPFGHIHGRRLTATKPGIYEVGFRAWDTSANGAQGGPLHTPSDVLVVRFQAGVNIVAVRPEADRVQVSLAAPVGYLWRLQSQDQLPGSVWTDVGSPLPGMDTVVEITDDRPLKTLRLYRAAGTSSAP